MINAKLIINIISTILLSMQYFVTKDLIFFPNKRNFCKKESFSLFSYLTNLSLTYNYDVKDKDFFRKFHIISMWFCFSSLTQILYGSRKETLTVNKIKSILLMFIGQKQLEKMANFQAILFILVIRSLRKQSLLFIQTNKLDKRLRSVW